MAGGIAQAFYREIPAPIASRVRMLLDGQLKSVLNEFEAQVHYA
jgi:hypothetical protein